MGLGSPYFGFGKKLACLSTTFARNPKHRAFLRTQHKPETRNPKPETLAPEYGAILRTTQTLNLKLQTLI
jgi:hypothetical protein